MWLLGVVVRRYIDFLILLIPTLVSVLFYSSIPTFCSFFCDVIHLFDWKSAVEHDGGV